MCVVLYAPDMSLQKRAKYLSANNNSLLSEPVAASSSWRNENDEFLCTGIADTSCFNKTIAALASPSYAPATSIHTYNQRHKSSIANGTKMMPKLNRKLNYRK